MVNTSSYASIVGILLASALLSTSPSLAQQGKGISRPAPILQVHHIQGDPYYGFRTSCLVLFSDGRYHREHRVQTSSSGHARPDWDPPMVFEGELRAGETAALLAQVGEPNFASFSRVDGDLLELRYKVVFYPDGHVVPHDDIDFFTVAVAHPRSVQVFQVGYGSAHREPVSKLVEWFGEVEKRPNVRLTADRANGCSSLAYMASSTDRLSGMDGFKYPIVRGSSPSFHGSPITAGKVKLQFVVNPDGTVGAVRVPKGTSADGARIVTEEVKKWTFYPARLLGVPVGFPMQAEIGFSDNSTVTLSPLGRLHSSLDK